MPSGDTREVTLVVVDSDGAVRGQTDTRIVSGEHWQEVAAVQKTFPGAIVLRLLQVIEVEDKGTEHVFYLAQIPQSDHETPLEDCDLEERYFHPQPLRMPWAEVNGPKADLDWASKHIKPTAAATQIRTWNLSAIWSIPTESGKAWLKCVPTFFKHEAAVLTLLSDQSVPTLLASEGQRLLLKNMPGVDGYGCTDEQRMAGIEQLVLLQKRSTALINELAKAEVPQLSLPELAEQCRELLLNNGAEVEAAEIIKSLPNRLAQLADSDIANVLVHGDFHAGNLRIGAEKPLIFDWGDSLIGHPFLDIVWNKKSIVDAWLALWQAEYPKEDTQHVWQLIRPLANLRTALVYQHFLDNIEPTERIYHCDDVPNIIESSIKIELDEFKHSL